MDNEQLVAEIQNGKTEHMEQLWLQVEKFIRQQAWKRLSAYENQTFNGVTYEDLYISGYLALVDAVKDYDATRDMSFLNYLDFHLRRVFTQELGLRTTRTQNDPLRTARSLDKVIENKKKPDEKYTLADFVPDPQAEADFYAILDDAELNDLKEFVNEALQTLPKDQEEYVRAYMSNDFVKAMTDRQFNISNSKGSAILEKAYKQLRLYVRQHKERVYLADYLDAKAGSRCGLSAWKNSGFTSITEYLALELIRIEEDLERMRRKKYKHGEEINELFRKRRAANL